MKNYAGVERRRFIRIPFWFVTKYRIYPHGAGSPEEFHQGIGKNISVGGICFEAKDKYNKDELLEVEIDMPALEHAVKVVGQVVWARTQDGQYTQPLHAGAGYIYGIAFSKINPEDIESVKKIVDTFS